MPRSPRQKLKLLYLMQILWENTDEEHPMTVAEMIDALERRDVAAERKSIYDDLESLRLFGLDIVQQRSRTVGYYLGERTFELPELKLLVDSVQSSKFITEKKTLSLIRKLEGLTSVHEARALQRQVYVRGRVKSMNESVYYNVDELSAAITRDRVIRFRYFEYAVSRERRFRRDGDYYEVSPFALTWDNENYYLIGWENAQSRMKHYRVDKMSGIEITDAPRQGKEAFDALDMSAYTQRVFGMFTGSEETVTLRFANHLEGAVLDRFGREAILSAADEEHFTVQVKVAVSPQFYGWLFGFGGEAEILSPERVRNEMRDMAEETARRHR